MNNKISVVLIFFLSSNFMLVLSNLDKRNDFQINSEELLRRRRLSELHLAQYEKVQEDWIEPYSVHVNMEHPKAFSFKPSDLKRNSFDDTLEAVSKEENPEASENVLQSSEAAGKRDSGMKKEIIGDFLSMSKDSVELQEILDSDRKFHKKRDSAKDKTPLVSSIEKPAKNLQSVIENVGSVTENNHDQVTDNKVTTFLEKNIVDQIKATENSLNISKEIAIESNYKQINNTEKNFNENLTEKNSVEMNDTEKNFNENLSEKNSVQINDTEKNSSNSSEAANNIENLEETKIEEVYRLSSLNKGQLGNQDIIEDKSNVPFKELKHPEKILQSFLSEFGDESKDWVEPHIYILRANEYANSPNQKTEFDSNLEPNDLKWMFDSKVTQQSPILECTREKQYFNRLLKKLLSKIEETEYKSISLFFSIESINQLKALSSSENFDVIAVDEFFSSIISNAIINEYGWNKYVPSFQILLYAVCIAIFVLLYSLRKKPFSMLIVFLILIILCSVLMHTFKMYKMKIAEKHHTLSSISLSHCTNILTENSGIYDHVMEYFRKLYYHEDCKKYYETVMVDATYEMNPLVVLADLITTVFLQCFHVLAHTLNYFVKNAFYGTTVKEGIAILLIFTFIMLLWFKYSIKLPFVSFEPSLVRVGSRAEDLAVTSGHFLGNLLPGNSNKHALNVSNYIENKNIKKGGTEKISYQKDNSTSASCTKKPLDDKCCVSCRMSKIDSGFSPNEDQNTCSTESVKTENIPLLKELKSCSNCICPSPNSNSVKSICDEISSVKAVSESDIHANYQSCLDGIKIENSSCDKENSPVGEDSKTCMEADFVSCSESI